MNGDNGSERKAPTFVIHTCPFRDLCWAEIDARTLGICVRDKTEAQRSHRRHRLPYQTRPEKQACGFEATHLKWCSKYKRWAGEIGLEEAESQPQQATLEL